MSDSDPLRTLRICLKSVDMRAGRWMLLLPLLSGCTDHEQVDCTAIQWPALSKCLDDNRSRGEPVSLVACLPFSQPVRTEGTWVVGFEKSDFFEGKRTPPTDIMWTQSTGSDLFVDEETREKIAPAGPQIYAFEVDVIGRRALCPMGVPNAYPIAVEKLKIKRRIGTR